MEKEILDYVLVPVGLLFMVAYHIWLLNRILKHPNRTVIGINSINRHFWVRAMMEKLLHHNNMQTVATMWGGLSMQNCWAKMIQNTLNKDSSKNGVLAVQTLRNNIMASTLLASTAIMLSSLIAVLMTGGSKGRSIGFHVYGDKSDLCLSIKFFSILVCFMVAFLFNVQSIRYYSHASILINVPYKKLDCSRHIVTAEYVGRTVNRGSYFWSLGLRAFYFSFPLFLWIFGPIPMFLCCIFLVFMLYFLDGSSDFGWVAATDVDTHTERVAV